MPVEELALSVGRRTVSPDVHHPLSIVYSTTLPLRRWRHSCARLGTNGKVTVSSNEDILVLD